MMEIPDNERRMSKQSVLSICIEFVPYPEEH